MQIVIEADGFPIDLSVARLALFSVQPFVCVVLLMTAIAIPWGVLESRRQMACIACDPGMFPRERKPRCVVVEGRLLPGPLVVTGLALRPLLARMFVIVLVAGVTLCRCVCVSLVRMAALAGDRDMLVAEWVASLAVVKSDVLPRLFGMAIGTGLSDRSLMFVVLLMAAVAVHRCVFEGGRHMAGFALDPSMFADERKPGLPMVKRRVFP